MLDYPALQAVAAVIREGSFERAAAGLGVTASAVSQRVRALEDRLGTLLIIRGAPCRATPAGEAVCGHMDAVRLLEHDALRQLPALAHAADKAGAATVVRIAVNGDSLGTWFPEAAARFAEAAGPDVRLDLIVEAEAHTAERLRAGEVLAAVTADPAPAPGCRTLPLGSLVYAATATPAFVRRWFTDGVTAEALARAPGLRFDRRDHLQARWALAAAGAAELAAPHYAPATQAFVDLVLAGLGWGMNPLAIAEPHLAAGRMLDLAPEVHLPVPLYWQHVRLASPVIETLTREVRATARRRLTP